MTPLTLYNSLTGAKEAFTPIDPSHVRLYACGPTVYSYAHIGNARMAVVFDVLSRLLKRTYPRVTYASNITDVEDKIIRASLETGEPIDVLTRKFERIYNEDMEALGCAPPDIQPRATEHIAEMITIIEHLITRGHAYAADGHVLFSVPSYPAYGRLSHRSRDDQIAGARVEVAPYKRDPADFVLWKPSTPDQPGWDSPWNFGRPGWHIECSAMVERHLGPLPFDIHGGGADLKFPHHENEIAQSCGAHGLPPEGFARIWVHNGFLTVEGEKMAKSVGNIRLAHDLLKAHHGEVLRFALLSAHYRQPLDWSETLLHQAKTQLDTLYRALYDLRDVKAADTAEANPIVDALYDDLNTPKAIAAFNAFDERDPATRKRILSDAATIFGILQCDPAAWLGYGQANDEEKAKIDALVQARQDARKAKDFARADAIRKQLEADGILIEDTADGPQWKRA